MPGLYILVGSGYLLYKFAKSFFRPSLVSYMLIGGGIAFIVIERWIRNHPALDDEPPGNLLPAGLYHRPDPESERAGENKKRRSLYGCAAFT